MTADMDEVAIATVRRLSMDAVQTTPSMRPLGACAPLEDLEGKLGSTPDGDAPPGMLVGGAAA